MRYGSFKQYQLEISPSASQTLPLSQNQSEFYSVAFPVSNSGVSLQLEIYDLDGNSLVYNQTWYSGLTLEAQFVQWSKIVFTESSFSYTVTAWIKKMTADNSADMSFAHSMESVSISPLATAVSPLQTISYTEPTFTTVNSDAPTSGNYDFTASFSLSVASDIIIIPVVASAITISTGGDGVCTLSLNSTTIDTSSSSVAAPVAVGDMFDAISQTNVASGSNSLALSVTNNTLGSTNTGYIAFHIISVPHSTNYTPVFAQVTGVSGMSQNASLSGASETVSLPDVGTFAASFVEGPDDSSWFSTVASPDFTIKFEDSNSNLIGASISVSALPYTNTQASLITTPSGVKFTTPSFTSLSAGGVTGYVSQVVLKS